VYQNLARDPSCPSPPPPVAQILGKVIWLRESIERLAVFMRHIQPTMKEEEETKS
jgi:hypothetical protein